MTVGPRGISRDEIRELVHEYYVQPYGTRKEWLASQPVTEWTFRRWRKMIQEGDLDRNLIPREHGNMARTNGEWSAFEKARAKEIAQHESEVEQLKGRIRELEGTNTALGKAIGLLHELNVPESDTARTNDPKSSSKPRTGSSGADNAHRIAASGPRVCRSITVDLALPAEPPRTRAGPARTVRAGL